MLAALADNPDLEIAADSSANQHVKTLVGNQPAAGEHQSSARVDTVEPPRRLIIFRDVDAERDGVAFVGKFPQQRGVFDQYGVGDDDCLGLSQRSPHQWLHEAPQAGVGDDVRMPVHDQRPVAAKSEREHEVGEREGRMQREQIVLGDPAPQPPRIGRRRRQRQHISERAHPFHRDVVDDDLAFAAGPGTDQDASREDTLQARTDVADHRKRPAEQIGVVDLEDVKHRRAPGGMVRRYHGQLT